MKKTLLILFILPAFYININAEKIPTVVTHDSIPEYYYLMYLKWNDTPARDSVLNTIPGILDKVDPKNYSDKAFIKTLNNVKILPRYTKETSNNFRFLFADSIRFKDNKKHVSAIMFQGTFMQRRLIDEILYITLDKSFESNTSADIMPLFNGGYEAMVQYLNEEINIPDNIAINEKNGHVLLGFVVNESGVIDKVKILESANDILDKEAYRLVKSMPAWKPGIKNGRIPVFLTIQLVFRP